MLASLHQQLAKRVVTGLFPAATLSLGSCCVVLLL
jgi:hypothetical protein